MDSIKSVIQDTMQTIHENIDKVQSNVDNVTGGKFFSVVYKTWQHGHIHGNSNTENYYGSPISDLASFLVT
jgi:hypothetical protein